MAISQDRVMREKMIAQYLKKPNGLKLLAASMTQPLRQFQDYESVGRVAFQVETLAQGQDPLLDADVTNTVAYQVADLGQDIITLVNPKTVRVDTQELAANPEVSYSRLAAGKYDIKSRVEQYSRSEIFRVEDRMIFNALLAAATHKFSRPLYTKDIDRGQPVTIGQQEVTIPGNPVNAPITVAQDKVSIASISAAMAQIERHGGLKPTFLFMNPANSQILRTINANNVNGFYADFDTSKEIMNSGFLATLFGLTVLVSPEIPTDTLLITAEPEFTGRVIERVPLTVIPYEDAPRRVTGLSLFSEVGIICHNAKAVAAVKITA